MTNKMRSIFGFGFNGATVLLDSHENGKHIWLTEPSTGIRVGVGRNGDDQPFVQINTETAKEPDVNGDPMLSVALNYHELYDVEPTGPHECSELHKHQPADFAGALALFKHATATLNRLWDHHDGAIFGETYPKCLPNFEDFASDVMAMEIQEPKPELPDLPPIGTLVRARYDLDCGGHGVWRAGWDGFIVSIDIDSVSVESYRYLGPGMHEWNNCRVISGDDAYGLYEHDFDRRPVDQDDDALLAYALLQEFEVI